MLARPCSLLRRIEFEPRTASLVEKVPDVTRPSAADSRAAKPAADRSQPPSRAGRTRGWLFRLAAIALALAIFPGIPELCVRWAAPSLDGFRAIEFGGDRATARLIMNDWDLSWKLRPDTQTRFLGERITTDRHGFRQLPEVAGKRTLLCLGDSTPFGWKMADGQAYPDLLHATLQEETAGGPWRTLNAGVPGYSSYQVRRQAERLIPAWRPDVVVVCVGNNDAWPVERSDRQALAERSTLSRALVAGLSHCHFAIWVKDRWAERNPTDLVLPNLDRAVPRVSRDEYRENLARIARLAREHGGRVIFLAPPVNIHHQPVRIDQTPGFQEFQDEARRVAGIVASGRTAPNREALDRFFAASPDDFRYRWLHGAALSQWGDLDAGAELLEEALEADPFPEGCKRSYRQAVVELAREHDSPCIDVNAIFRDHARPASPQRLYLDWCHPVAAGHRLIADEIVRAIRKVGPSDEAGE